MTIELPSKIPNKVIVKKDDTKTDTKTDNKTDTKKVNKIIDVSHTPMECNICFNTIDTDNLLICGNKKCSFRMCSNCTRSYKQFDNKNCPQCRLPIKTKQFLNITPRKTTSNAVPNTASNTASNNATPLHRMSGRECCIRITYFMSTCRRYNDDPDEIIPASVRFGERIGECCDNICNKENTSICTCITGVVFVTFVPKILGYYLCKGCAGAGGAGGAVNIFDAWRSCDGFNDICQPIAGAAVIGMGWCIAYTCCEILKIGTINADNTGNNSNPSIYSLPHSHQRHTIRSRVME